MKHFLDQELERLGASEKLRAVSGRELPWLPAEIVARFALADWPGNVRQLQNAVYRLVAAGHALDRLVMPPGLEDSLRSSRHFGSGKDEPVASSSEKGYRDPDEVGYDEIRSTLRWNRFEIKPTAETLNVSRSTLYKLMEKCGIRRASQLTREEIEQALDLRGGKIEAAAEFLEVSLRGLRRRMRQLGMLPGDAPDGD